MKKEGDRFENQAIEEIDERNNIILPAQIREEQDSFMLKEIIESLSIKNRIPLKIIYINFYSITGEEIKYLAKINKTNTVDICDKLAAIEKNNIKNKRDTTPAKIAAEILQTNEDALNTKLSRLREKIRKLLKLV